VAEFVDCFLIHPEGPSVSDAADNLPNEQFRCRVMLIVAAVLWSLSGLFVKSPPLDAIPLEVRGPLLACYRALFAGAMFSLLVKRRSIRWRPGLVPMVGVFTAMNVLFVSSMTRTTSAAAIFLQYTATAWVALLSFFLLKERLRRPTLVALAGALAGILWIVLNEEHAHHAVGNFLALGSGFSLACTLVMLRVLRNEDSTWLTALNHLSSGLILLPWVLMIDVSLSPTQWLLIAGLGIVQMGTPYVLFARAVRSVPVTEAVLLTLLEPILNPIWVLLFWGEQPAAHVWSGGALILGGLLAMAVLRRRAPRE
jgi:DME family drug/metabolite transporter